MFLRKAKQWFGGLIGKLVGERQAEPEVSVNEVTMGERELTLDAFSVKRKLGRSWFTRRLNPRTRRRILRELNSAERAIAREEGWLL